MLQAVHLFTRVDAEQAAVVSSTGNARLGLLLGPCCLVHLLDTPPSSREPAVSDVAVQEADVGELLALELSAPSIARPGVHRQPVEVVGAARGAAQPLRAV